MADEDNKKSEIKLSEKVEKIASSIEALTVVEVAELASYLEDKFGVTAVAQAAPATGGAADAQPAGEEKSTFNVVITAAGDNKLGVIKAVREVKPDLGLMDAKKLVETAPQQLLADVKKEEAEEAKKKIEAAGGTVELK